MDRDGATAQAAQWLAGFADALARRDAAAAAAAFGEECFWRDLVAFTWNIHTAEGRPAISAMLEATAEAADPSNWALDGEGRFADGVVQAWFTFETAVGRGKGHLRLRDGRCWTLFTALMELKGHEEKAGALREAGTEHGAVRGRRSWRERRAEEAAALGMTRQPYALVVGGGQGGIALAARLKRLGVPALVVDRHPRAGDSWRSRYQSLCLHDPVWYDHMPYLPFPDHWPVYTPKDKMGDWLEAYVGIMELDYWTSAECRSASWDAERGEWSVSVLRDGAPVTLRPKHLVLATGMSGHPEMPRWPGTELFRGTLRHSSRHPGGAGWEGRRCVVVGSNNSAHDIAADLWEHGAEVAMLQRSPTLVVRSDTLARLGRPLYSEAAVAAGITTDLADLTVASMPYRLVPRVQTPLCRRIQAEDAAFYDSLRAAGFLLTFGEDESGIGPMYLRRGSGYYIDVGASELVADGRIALRSGVEVARLVEGGLVLDDGTELPADLIVCATGYGPMTRWAADLVSPEIAARVGKVWGLGSDTAKDPGPWEGELRNMWKPTAQDGLWFHGGNLAQARHYSRYVALQLKARFEGIPTPVHGRAPVHHPE